MKLGNWPARFAYFSVSTISAVTFGMAILAATARDNRLVSEIDRSLAIRAALIQLAGVAVISIVLAILLPHSFFEDWGWLSGPGAWAVCSLITASALRLPLGMTLLGAILAGLPSLLAVIVGLHWLGRWSRSACSRSGAADSSHGYRPRLTWRGDRVA